MVIEFSIKNFLSYNTKATINFCPNDNISKHILILGANASGKSNLKHALTYCINFMLGETVSKTDNIHFKYDNSCLDKVSKFELILQSNEGNLFKYQLEVIFSQSDIKYESLQFRSTKDTEYQFVFERTSNDPFTIGDSVKEGEWKFKHIEDSNIAKDSNETVMSFLLSNYANNRQYMGELKQILSNFNRATLGNIQFDQLIDQNSDIYNKFVQIADPSFEKIEEINFSTKKSITHKDNVQIQLRNESNGTIRMMELAPYIIKTLKYGGFLCIDEFEFALHPILVRSIVTMFNDIEFNTKNAQLLLIGHSGTLMRDPELDNYDIWICQRDFDYNTQIQNLGEYYREFENNTQASAEKRLDDYLSGRLFSSPTPQYILDTIKNMIHKEDLNA